MNNAEIIKGINVVISGLEAIRAELESGTAKTTAETEKTNTKTTGKVPETASESKKSGAEHDSATYTRAELESMRYNDFKKLAATLGVDCKGTRDEIMERVVELGVVEDEGGATEQKKPASVSKVSKTEKTPTGKLGAQKSSKDSGDEFSEQAEEIAKETSKEDIIESLKEVGVKANKMNYKTMLAKALREGLLSVDDDEEDADESDGDDISADSYFPEYDLSDSNNPDSMTDEREAAINEKMSDILKAASDGELTSDDIIDFLQNNAEQDELDLLGDDYTEEELLRLYMEVTKHFIDNDGEEHEPGEPYEVGDENFCCGHVLKYDKKTKKYICEHCATEYEE